MAASIVFERDWIITSATILFYERTKRLPPSVNLQWESPQLYDYLPLECPYLRSRLLPQGRHCLRCMFALTSESLPLI